jgi:hypothetical protein
MDRQSGEFGDFRCTPHFHTFHDIAGGAVMGQFPELCYSSLLQPFVDKTGMAVPWLQ